MKSKMMKLALMIVTVLTAPGAFAFSLLGPYTSWQVTAIGYNLPGDIGGPMQINDGFRWNIPVITYAYDASFVKYFGAKGIHAVDEAISYFDDLPPVKKMSPDLSEYSTLTLREHPEAIQLGVIDVKSTVMAIMMEEMGFTDSRRFVFTLRARTTETVGGVTITNYTTVMRNFDPVTFAPSRYVNGVLYTFLNQEFQNPNYADAVEQVVFAPEGVEALPVAGYNGVFQGLYRVGLSRDDVGGIRFLYHPNNYAVETLLPTVTAGFGVGARSAWIPYTGITNATTVTNVVVGTNGSNLVVSVGLRGGRNQLRFQRVFFDSIFGSTFTAITNAYTDVTVSTNQTLVVQALQRGITQPDILFVSEDLDVDADGIPFLVTRSSPAGWIDNDLLNGSDEAVLSHGPGVIAPPIRIALSDQLPFFRTSTGSATIDPGEESALFSGVWGSFDGSGDPITIYPTNRLITIQQLRRDILRGGLGQ